MSNPTRASHQPRTYKRGETIYRQGDLTHHCYYVVSGIVSLVLHRGRTNATAIEIIQVPAGQIFGEEGLWGEKSMLTSAVANNEVTVFPLEQTEARELLNGSSPLLKVFEASLLARQRLFMSKITAVKLEAQDPTPCPAERIVGLFATIYHTASYKGTRKGHETTVVWPAYKKYAQQTFLESPVRLEQAVMILVKLGLARLEFIPCETDPEAPDELGFVHFGNLEPIRLFFEALRKAEPPKDPLHLAILKEIESWNANGKVNLPGTQTHAA